MDPADHKSSGWYPDPANPSIQRWWNGISWGDQTRNTNGSPIRTATPAAPSFADPYAQITTPPPTSPTTSTPAAGGSQFRQLNPFGYAGVALGFVSLLFNFFGVPSALAIIFSAIGLRTAYKLRAAGPLTSGLYWCIAGLVMGMAETAFYLANAIK